MSDYQTWDTLPAFETGRSEAGKPLPALADLPRWFGRDGAPPPAIGARITITMNRCGPAVVTGYFTEGGFLGVRCTLLDPPEWHKRQNKGKTDNGHVFGPEFITD